ncbi:MAG: class I SAM-dependent methyltransferase [Bacteroidota bacterium]
MNVVDKLKHWEQVYNTKSFEEVSWYQDTPSYFLKLIANLNIPKEAPIIDVGCGESKLLYHLYLEGYHHLSGLDISSVAIEKNIKNYSHLQPSIEWICNDICTFLPRKKYFLWYDRAVFHFLRETPEIETYIQLTTNYIEKGGYLILSTFSKNGPLKCSGLDISSYNHEDIALLFESNFEVIYQSYHDHETPFNTLQNFQTSILKRK